MDYIFFTLGTLGDNQPFIRIAAELTRRGLRVLFLGNEKFANLIESQGIAFEAVSSKLEYIKAYDNPNTWSHYHSREHYREYHFPAIEPTFRIIQNIVKSGARPFVVFQDVDSGAKMASDVLGLKHCQIVLAPSGLFSAESPSFPLREQLAKQDWYRAMPVVREKAVKSRFERIYKPFINPLRQELGLAALSINELPMVEQCENLIALFPDWLKRKPSDWPKQVAFTGFPFDNKQLSVLNDDVADFINKKGQPIVYSFGTGVPLNKTFITKIKAISEILSMPAILVGKPIDNHGNYELGDNILSVDYIEFSVLFAKAKLVVHHGGIGTSAECLKAGVPQLISPFAFDQPDNAFMLWELGVANARNFLSSGARDIANIAIELLCSPLVAEKCETYKQQCHLESVINSSNLLEEMAR